MAQTDIGHGSGHAVHEAVRKHKHRARAAGDPVEEFFRGNDASGSRLFGVTFQKVFLNPSDKWDATHTFVREDMPTLVRVALQTEDWLRCRGVD